MTYEQLLKQRNYVLLDCVSGSTAYNLNTATSDVDKKGVFIQPKEELYGFSYQDQISNSTNDEVYFELKRFIELLVKNNPNILELLNTPRQHVLFKHPVMELIKPENFLSKLCRDTFAGYAQTQVKKAKGLNKKINNPIDREKKSVLDFCYVIHNNGSLPLTDWLIENNLQQESCGLVNVNHFRNVYLLYSADQLPGNAYFNGIVSGSKADDVQLSSIPQGIKALATMTFNKDGYSVYCRNRKEYLEWEEKRNQVRFEGTLIHGKNYDAKNMMHTFRLLQMAEEIALHQEIRVHREDREFLLSIRSGAFEFDDLIKMIDDKKQKVDELYESSSLPEQPDPKKAEDILVQIREELYHSL